MGQLIEESVNGYEKFKEKIQTLSSTMTTPIVILFTGSSDASGQSWCPDCVVCKKILKLLIKLLNKPFY